MPSISRRDFLNGVALTVAAGLTPAAQIAAEPLRYPPALTGLRGQHAGSFETAHAQAREGKRFALDRLPVEETYDLLVVGAGISGLAAAAFYRRAVGPSARILVLDNHDDFGGHAKRNEFTLDDRLVIGYGGSESIDSPKTHYSDVAKGLLRDLGVEIERFETAFELALYAGTRDPLAGKTAEEKLEILKRTSYRDYLTGPCGCSEEVANCFQGRT